MVGGGWEANSSLARLSEGLPSAPFAGYSDTDLRLAEGRERGVEDDGTDCGSVGDGAETLGVGGIEDSTTAGVGEIEGSCVCETGVSNSFANTLGVCTLGVCTLGGCTLGECTAGGVGGAGK